jgi:hypothetical protein
MLRGAGNEHSCRFDLVRSAGEDGDLAVRTIWNALKDRDNWDLVELPYVPDGGAAEQLLQLAHEDGFLTGKYESYESPYIPLLSSDADFIPLEAHFRSDLRRRLRKARAKWDVVLRRITTANSTELNRFYDLEVGGWKGKKKTAIACSEATRRFYDNIAKAGAQFGYFSLYLLEFGDTVVAGHFGLSHQGRYYCPKVAYNESYAAYGPGHLIVDAILRDILPQSFREFDFVGPWMDWKGRWTRLGRKHSFCYIFHPGIRGHALYALRLKLVTALRRLVRPYRNGTAR